MQHVNRKLIRLKEKELAALDKRMSDRRSTIERELAALDEQAQEERSRLEQDIRMLQKAAQKLSMPDNAP